MSRIIGDFCSIFSKNEYPKQIFQARFASGIDICSPHRLCRTAYAYNSPQNFNAPAQVYKIKPPRKALRNAVRGIVFRLWGFWPGVPPCEDIRQECAPPCG